jgi:hypothetical protein
MEYQHIGAPQRSFAQAAAVIGLLLLTVAMGVTAARAASLGKLEIDSGIGQPFRGRIEVLNATRHELDTLGARLASAETYRQAGVAYPAALQGLRFRLATRPGAGAYISVTSSQPFSEPVVDLLLELAWFKGTSSHAYTALIDPAGAGKTSSGGTPVAVMQPKRTTASASAKIRKSIPVSTRAAPVDRALADQIRSKEEQLAVQKHRLAAAQERITELQRTVQEQEDMLTRAAAEVIASEMHAAPKGAIARVSHETNRRHVVAPAPAAADLFGEPLHVAGGASVMLLGVLAFIRVRRNRTRGGDDGYYREAPTFQPAA